MKKVLLILLYVMAISCSQNNSEKVNNSNSQLPIDVRHQEIYLQIKPSEHLKGETTLFLSVDATTSSIKLSASEMDIIAVEVDGEASNYVLDNDNQELLIKPKQELIANKEIAVKISYETSFKNHSDPANIWGSFGKGVRYFKPSMTEKERRLQVWAFGEAESAKYWLPCNDDPKDLRTTHIKIEALFMVLTNGKLINSIKKSNVTEWVYKEEIPYPAHQTFFVVGDYHNYQQQYEDITMNNYGYPDEKIGTKESVISLPDMMKFFSDYTARKYPYDTYSQIFVQDFAGWKPGLATSIITENMIDDKTTHEDFLYGWDLTQGEALSAQWFGNYIKPKSWKDAWLSKGFSRYFSGLYNQYKNGNTEFLTYQLSPDLSTYLNDWNRGVNTQIVPDSIEDLDAFVNGNAPYAKGARVLHMLRKELGENKWQTVIRKYFSEYGGKLVSTSDFINVVNDVTGKPMDWFFEQWIYGVGHPIFSVSQEYDSQNNNFTLKVFQKQKKDSLVGNNKIPYFKGKVQIEINDKIQEVQLLAEEENRYTFSLEKEPALVNFDFEDAWIKEETFGKTASNLISELESSADDLHRVALMQKIAGLALRENSELELIEKVKATLLDKALNETYWRMRLIAISQLAQLYPAGKDGKVVLDDVTEKALLKLVKREESWVKAWTINFLGNTRNKKYVPLYLNGLKDYSDRVVFMSAIALGKSGDSRAYNALIKLPEKPSWKNQSLISAMYGLKELKDARSYHFVLNTLTDSNNPHWNLGTPIWDHRLAAAFTLVALDKVEEGYDKVLNQYKDALANNNINDIFYNAQILSILGDKRGKEVFVELKNKFAEDNNALKAIEQLEKTFLNSMKSN